MLGKTLYIQLPKQCGGQFGYFSSPNIQVSYLEIFRAIKAGEARATDYVIDNVRVPNRSGKVSAQR